MCVLIFMFLVTLFFPSHFPPYRQNTSQPNHRFPSSSQTGCSGQRFHCTKVAWISFGFWTLFWLGFLHHPQIFWKRTTVKHVNMNRYYTFGNTCICFFTYAYLCNISMCIKRSAGFTYIVGHNSRERERGDLFLLGRFVEGHNWRTTITHNSNSLGLHFVKLFGLWKWWHLATAQEGILRC